MPNEPCPCGSGKKYKKCCLARDEAQARLDMQRARVAASVSSVVEEPSTPASAELSPSTRPVAEPPPLSPQEAAAEEAWERFEQADYEEKIAIYQETLDAGIIDGELAFEMLDSIWSRAEEPVEQERFRQLVAQLRQEAPDVYWQEARFFNLEMLRDALPAGKMELVPELLELFVRDPVRSFGEFFRAIEMLMYYDQTVPLLEAMSAAWPELDASPGVMEFGKIEFLDAAVSLALFRHLERGGAPRLDDPDLQAALSRFPPIEKQEALARDVERLSGSVHRQWTLADFDARASSKAKPSKETLGANLRDLSTEWLGDAHWTHGVPFGRGELVRTALATYGWEQVGRQKAPLVVLVPERQSLDRYLAGHFQLLNHQPYKVAALMELLPHYLRFLVERGLLGHKEAVSAFTSLGKLKDDLGKVLANERDPNLAEAVERAWQRDPFAD